MIEPTELYRHYDGAGRLLYVGITMSTGHRTKEHIRNSGWADQIVRIEIDRLPFRWLAVEAEKTAILTERPLFNRTYNSASIPSVAKSDSSIRASKRRIGVARKGSRGPAPGQGGRPKKGTESNTLVATRPWEAEGISQRTWYRRKRQQEERKAGT